MKILKQQTIEWENTCGALYNPKVLSAAVLWFAQEPVARLKKVFLYGRYPAVSIRKHKLHIHRLISSYLWKGLPKGAYVHHIDGNKLNALQENLGLMSASAHQRLTNLGRKQSPQHITKRISAMRKTRYENKELLK